MNKVTSQELKDGLRNFYGTEQYYYNPLYPNMRYTDGVKYFAEVAGAYWFIDMVGFDIEPKRGKRDFLNIVLKSTGSSGVVVVENGNGKVLEKKVLDYTDCPEGEWQFFLEGNVLILPSEH